MSIDRRWLGRQVKKFKAERPVYAACAKYIEKKLGKAVGPICGSAIVQARAKKLPSFARKSVKYAGELKDPAHELTDLCGARVIVQTPEQAQAVNDYIRDEFVIDEAQSQDTFKRLGAEEFGYRSVHYIVIITLDPRDPPAGFVWPKGVPKKKSWRLSVEIQTRTFAQHVWADFSHDLFYKSPFDPPTVWRRESARVAAQLEAVDETLTHIVDGLHRLETNLGTYHDEETTSEEIERALAVLRFDEKNTGLVNRIARLQMSIGRHRDAVDLLESFEGSTDEDFKSNLGYALCRKSGRPGSVDYKRGIRLLSKVGKEDPAHVEALTRLAELTEGGTPRVLRERWQAAFEADPSDPRALTGYLRNEISQTGNLSLVPLLRPSMEDAILRSEDQVAVRVNLPRALYHIAELKLLLGEPFDALRALCRALTVTLDRAVIDDMVRVVDLLSTVEDQVEGFDWFQRVLLLVSSARNGALHKDLRDLVHTPAEGGVNLQPGHDVVIVAGGCDPSAFHGCRQLRPVLARAFSSFSGTVISGGTRQGICGLIAGICKPREKEISLVGYLPGSLPSDGSATRDSRYSIRRASGKEIFSPMEPIRNWVDILDSGIEPASVRLIGVNGGEIAGFEYRLAAAMGAQVGVFRESGREADRILSEQHEPGNERIVFLPHDRETLAEFLKVEEQVPWAEDRKAQALLAANISDAYEMARLKTARRRKQEKIKVDPQTAAEFENSNREQARHILVKLRRIGLTVARKRDSRRAALTEFKNTKQHQEWVEKLAVMEHGRWNAERLSRGWTLGPRDDEKRQRPSLVPWEDLSEDDRDKDREAVRTIPALLDAIGYKIVKLTRKRR